MLTKDLIAQTAKQSGLTKQRTEELLSSLLAVVNQDLMSGKTVMLQGLGSLSVKEKKERNMVHPKTGERRVIPAKKQLSFKPTASIKEAVK